MGLGEGGPACGFGSVGGRTGCGNAAILTPDPLPTSMAQNYQNYIHKIVDAGLSRAAQAFFMVRGIKFLNSKLFPRLNSLTLSWGQSITLKTHTHRIKIILQVQLFYSL